MVIVEGERFASAVTARGAAPRRRRRPRQPVGEPITGASRRPVAVPPSAARSEFRLRPDTSRWWYAALGLVAGLILGAGGSSGRARSAGTCSASGRGRRSSPARGPGSSASSRRPTSRTSARRWPRPPPATPSPSARANIAKRSPSSPACSWSAPATACLKPPVGAGGAWTAVTARGVTDARPERVRHRGGPGPAARHRAAGRGADRRSRRRRNLRAPATPASICGPAPGSPCSNSLIRDNEGSGVIVRARAEPRLERNVIIHNGHGPQRRAGVVVEPGAAPELEGNGIGGNGGEAVQGWPAATLPALAQRNVLSPAPGAGAGDGTGPAGADAGHGRRRGRGRGRDPDESDCGRVGRLSPSGAPRRRHEPRLSRHAAARRPRRRRQVGRPGRATTSPAPSAAAPSCSGSSTPSTTRVPDVLDIRAGAHELLIEMEYIDGEDLSTVLRSRGRFAAERRGRSLGGARRRARSRPPVRRRRRRRDVSTASSTAISSRATSASASPPRPAPRRADARARASASSTSASPRASAAPPARRATCSAARPTCRPSA